MDILELKGNLIGIAKMLDGIEVRYKENRDKLSGCINYLEQLANSITIEPKESGDVNEHDCAES